MRRVLPFLFILLLLLPMCLTAPAMAEDNLLKNGSFEEATDGWPKNWKKDMWIEDIGITYLSLETSGRDGGLCARVENVMANDARFAQTVSVKPHTVYRLHGYIKAQRCDPLGAGANISILDCYEDFPCLYETDGEWIEVESFIKTDEGQKSIRVAARLGGYSADNTGIAWFDDLSLQIADSVPEGASIINLTEYQAISQVSQGIDSAATANGPSLVAVALFLIVAICAYILYRRDVSIPKIIFFVLLLGAAAIRAYLMFTRQGYVNDIKTFMAWALRMAEVGPNRFYQTDLFCDYPPGYMYILWITGGLLKLFGVDLLYSPLTEPMFHAIVKLIPVLMDLSTMMLLWHIAKKRIGETSALLLAALYALNPAILIDGATWGQSDAVMSLGLLLTVYLVCERKWMLALPVFTVTVLMKPQALMAGPIGLVALLFEMRQSGIFRKGKTLEADATQKRALLLDVAKGIGFSVLFAVLLLSPFVWGKANPIGWVISLYRNSISGYQHATLNTANLYYLLGANWVPLENQLGPFSYGTWGTILMVATLAFVVILYWIRGDRENLPFFCALTYIGLYLLGVMMHERYLYPALVMLLFAYIRKKDWRMLVLLIGFSVTFYINCAWVLRDLYLPVGVGFWPGVLSVINLILGAFAVWVAVDPKTHPLPAPDQDVNQALQSYSKNTRIQSLSTERTPGFFATMRRVDWLVMAGLTILYSIVGYYALGSTIAPQTSWMSTTSDEEVIFDLGESKTFQIMYYPGINQRDETMITVEFSDDGESWHGTPKYSEEGEVVGYTLPHGQVTRGECFSWRYINIADYNENGEPIRWIDYTPLVANGRYVRMMAYMPSLTLMEVVFRDLDGNAIPVVDVQSVNEHPEKSYDPSLLVDEAHTMPESQSYLNSTYFDEIYHARTGYEHANGLSTYEWTHPPLGKVFIMLGIKLFGMTPFGWRFMGTLMGVLMVPAMYLLGKLLFRKTKFAMLTAFVMAFDLMHLTQTRIATIDSYAVLFIILMYLCMFRYLQMSFFRDGWRTLLPLGLSGVFFGLGCASKWICIYSGAGLAVLFAWSMVTRYLEWKTAKESGDAVLMKRVEKYFRYLFGTLGFCVMFFILIPFAIYYLSYIPHFAWEGGLSFRRFLETQSSIFRYHSTLIDDHDFNSPWYEWPLILKPMWYYTGTPYAGEGKVATIMCMGNPAIWWIGLGTLLYVVWRWLKPYLLFQHPTDHRPAMIVLAFASQFVPWMLVPRTMFIYHYFGSLPFLMCTIVYVFERIDLKKPKLSQVIQIGYMAVVLLLFIGFYPIATGIPIPKAWADAMNWLAFLRLPIWRFGRWLYY